MNKPADIRFNALFALTLAGVFILSLRPIAAYDTLYTARVGRMIIDGRALPKTETLSWSAEGKPWLIHQPLAEVFMGLIDMAGGLRALSFTASAALVLFFILIYRFFTGYCRQSKLLALTLSFFTASAVDEFFIPRAQLFAQLLFTVLLILVYQRLNGKKIPFPAILAVSYVWANSHASFILGTYLLAAAVFTAWWHDRKLIKTFLLWTAGSLAVSILPPVGLQGWRVLLNFGQDITFLRAYIMEWAPLAADFPHFSFYAALVLAAGAVAGIAWRRTRSIRSLLLAAPLVPVIALPFTSLRHVPFGIIAAIVGIGIMLTGVTIRRRIIFAVFILLIPLSVWLFSNKYRVSRDSAWFFPWKAAAFLNANQLKGRMFNEMALGSFIMYTLPNYQVFFDGRVETFGCCEMRDFYALMQHKTDTRESFGEAWKQFDQKYRFSYALIPVSSYNPLEQTTVDRIAETLLDDPQWILIYVDDTMRIFVKKDGSNDAAISRFGMPDVTPLRLAPYRAGREADAQKQAERMLAVSESAVVHTILGEIEVKRKNTAAAQPHFTKAAAQNPYYGLPLLELAKGIGSPRLLEQAIRRSPYLGEAYLLLSDIYVREGNQKKAGQILLRGLRYNIDYISRRDIVKKLQQFN